MRAAGKRNLEIREGRLYLEDRELLDFIPCIKELKKIQTPSGIQTSYSIQITKNENVIQTKWIDKLYVKSWFELCDQCSDADLSDKERRLIEKYLQKQVPGLPVHREIYLDKSGWGNIGTGQFFFNKRIITKAVTGLIRTKKTTGIIRTEDYKFGIEKAEKILQVVQDAAQGVSWIVYLASYFDVLKGLFQKAGYPVEFIVNVYGKSGAGKTSLIKAICSPSHVFSFSQPQRRDSLLNEIQKFEGHTVLIDDYHPAEQKHDGERQNAIKDRLVRLVEENENAPNILISSEGLGGHVSMQDREVQIFLNGMVNWEYLTLLENRPDLPEEIRTAFYVQIVKNKEEVVDEIKKFCLESDRNHIPNMRPALRSARYLGYVRCVAHLFKKYFYDAYGITYLPYDIEADIQMQLERQERHMEIIRGVEQKGTYLISLVNMLKCTDILICVLDGKEFAASADTFYVNGQGMVFISPKALQFGMMHYFQTTDIPVKRIVNELKTADVLKTYDKGNELTVKYNGKRCYEIDIKSLEEYCNLLE